MRLPSSLVTSVHTLNRPASSDGMPGRIFVKLIFGGINPVSNAKQTFVMEQTPAELSEWPMFDLTDPTGNGFLRFLQNILSNA